MKNFCTVSDNNFCDRVWALNHSLKEGSPEYVLHVLAIDDLAYENFSHSFDQRNENIRVHSLENLKKSDQALVSSSENIPSYEAINVCNGDIDKARHMQFIWSLAPYFTWYCMESVECEDIMYIDADIYFFGNWTKIYDNLSDTSIGIVEHRCPYGSMNGKYNVGIVYFKSDFDGYKCLTWWKNCLLFTDNDYYSTHGTCGDQKYLELFEKLFDGVVVMDSFIGHLAPWNYWHHGYTGYGQVVWDDKIQDIMYCHFSNFKPNYDEGTYLMAPRHGLSDTPHSVVKKMYDEYYQILRSFHA